VLRGIEPLAYSIVSDYIRIVSDYNGCLAIPLNIDTITRSAHRPADWPPGGFGCVGFGFGVGMAGVQTLIRRAAPRSSCWGGCLPDRRPVDTVLGDARLLG